MEHKTETWHAAPLLVALLKTAVKSTCSDSTRPSASERRANEVGKLPLICDFQKSVSLPCCPKSEKTQQLKTNLSGKEEK